MNIEGALFINSLLFNGRIKGKKINENMQQEYKVNGAITTCSRGLDVPLHDFLLQLKSFFLQKYHEM